MKFAKESLNQKRKERGGKKEAKKNRKKEQPQKCELNLLFLGPSSLNKCPPLMVPASHPFWRCPDSLYRIMTFPFLSPFCLIIPECLVPAALPSVSFGTLNKRVKRLT